MGTSRDDLVERARARGAVRPEDLERVEARRAEYRAFGVDVPAADLLATTGAITPEELEEASRGEEIPSRVCGLEIVRLAGGTADRPLFLARRPIDGETFLVHACMLRRGDAPAEVDAFVRAMEDGRRLTGPGWIPVLEAGGADGAWAAVMAVPEGERLEDRLGSGRHFTPTAAVALLQRVADPLWELEALGRAAAFPDPSLILLGRDDRPSLVAMEVLLSTRPGAFEPAEFARRAANLLARLVGPERVGDPAVRGLLTDLAGGRLDALRPAGFLAAPPAAKRPAGGFEVAGDTPVSTPPLPPAALEPSRTPLRTAPPAAAPRPVPAWAWLAAAAVVAVGIALALRGGGAPREPDPRATVERPDAPTEEPPTVARTPVPSATPGRSDVGVKDPGLAALEEALAYRSTRRDDDPLGVVDRLRAVEARYGGTDAGARAAAERERFQREVEAEAERRADAITADVDRLLAADEVGAALERVSTFPRSLAFTRAVVRVEALRARVKERAEAAYAALRPALDAASDPSRQAQARAAYERVKSLGDPELTRRAEQRLREALDRAAGNTARRRELEPDLERAVGEALVAAGQGDTERARRSLEAAARGPLGDAWPDRTAAAREAVERVARTYEAAAAEWRARAGRTATITLREHGAKPFSVTPNEVAGDRFTWTRGGVSGGARAAALDAESVVSLALSGGRDKDGAAVLAAATLLSACGREAEAEVARARAEALGSTAPFFAEEAAAARSALARAVAREVAAADAVLERNRGEARAAYERATVTAPSNPLPWRRLGEWYAAERKPEEALEAWRRARALGDLSPDTLHGLARAAAAAGEPDATVLEAWRAFLGAAPPTDPRLDAARAEADRLALLVVRGTTLDRVKAAKALADAGKPAEAVAALEEAASADPTSIEVQKALARAAEKSDDVVKAYVAWRAAHALARTAKDAADVKEQADRLLRQHGERPTEATVRRAAEAAAGKGEFAAAAEGFRRAIAMSPLDVEARLGLGGALLGLALRTQSKALFEEGYGQYDVAVRVDPDDARGWQGRGELRRWRGDYDGAIRDASEALRRRKDFVAAYNTRGLASYQALQFDAALADFDVVATLAPLLATPRISRAGVYLALGRYDEAEADLKAAEDRKPTEAERQAIAQVREQLAARRAADRR